MKPRVQGGLAEFGNDSPSVSPCRLQAESLFQPLHELTFSPQTFIRRIFSGLIMSFETGATLVLKMTSAVLGRLRFRGRETATCSTDGLGLPAADLGCALPCPEYYAWRVKQTLSFFTY